MNDIRDVPYFEFLLITHQRKYVANHETKISMKLKTIYVEERPSTVQKGLLKIW